MAESDMQQRIDAIIDGRREVKAGYSPVLNRLLHMSDAECDASVEGEARADAFYRKARHACSCYPRGFISTPKAVKEQMKAEHLAAGVHAMGCPLWVDRSPLYSRHGDTVPQGYTLQQERADAEAESLERRGAAALRRFGQAD